MTLIPGDAKASILYALTNAELRHWPCTHFYAENVFPPDLYDRMLAHWPDERGEFDTSPDVYSGIDRLYLALRKDAAFDRLDPEKAAFWRDMRAIFFDQWFVDSLATRYQKEFNQHPWVRDGKVKRLKITPELNLNNDPVGWQITPHTQNLREFLFLVFYLPQPGQPESYGTSLYVPKQRKFRCDGGPGYLPKQFDLVTTAPYRPNSVIGLIKSDLSFHGVEPHQADGYRRTMFYALGLPFGEKS